MNKKWILWLIITGMMASQSLYAEGNPYRIRMQIFRIQPAGGRYDETVNMKNLLDPNYGFNAGIQWLFSDYLMVELGFDYCWMYVHNDLHPPLTSKSAFYMPAFYVSPILIYRENVIKPYLRPGIGVSPWRFTQKGPTSDTIKIEDEIFEKFNVFLMIGFGCEFKLSEFISVFGEGVYKYLFSEQSFTFNPAFGNQGFLQIGAGFMLHLERE